MKYFLQAYNLFLFTLALISVVRFGQRKLVLSDTPRSVLVVQLSKLGDMVCITPALHALRHSLPEAKIYVLGDALNKGLLQGNPDVDEYVVFKRENLFSTIRYFRDKKIEVAFIRGIGFTGLVIALLSGIPTVITGRVIPEMNFATRTYRWLLPFVHTVTFTQGSYMPREFLRLLEPIGIYTQDTKKYLNFSKTADERILQFLQENKVDYKADFVVGISVTAGNRVKEWIPKRFAEVADHLIEKHNVTVIYIGGPSDDIKTNETIALMRNSEKVVNAQGKCSIEELKALIARLDLFVSADTGPVYIAEAFNVPTIDITGPIDEKEQPPISAIHKVVIPASRTRPQLFVLNARGYDYKEARRQAESITVAMVVDVFESLYPHIRKKKS